MIFILVNLFDYLFMVFAFDYLLVIICLWFFDFDYLLVIVLWQYSLLYQNGKINFMLNMSKVKKESNSSEKTHLMWK